MSSSGARSGERMVHQDFIARIRFSNALPPPPNPPKLLDIPNTGLASGQYTTPGFASRLAREQPLNIEADAELGMPLDLVGMPGVFDGDERCRFFLVLTLLGILLMFYHLCLKERKSYESLSDSF